MDIILNVLTMIKKKKKVEKRKNQVLPDNSECKKAIPLFEWTMNILTRSPK